MSNAVARLSGKRSNCGYTNTSVKRSKVKCSKVDDLPTVDSAMTLQIVGKAIQYYYCRICACMTDHDILKCPNRTTEMGMACDICNEPCEIKEHKSKWELLFKFCVRCDVADGNHWSKDCPDPIFDGCDFDDVSEKCCSAEQYFRRSRLNWPVGGVSRESIRSVKKLDRLEDLVKLVVTRNRANLLYAQHYSHKAYGHDAEKYFRRS